MISAVIASRPARPAAVFPVLPLLFESLFVLLILTSFPILQKMFYAN
jgi:hypothetical protein